MFRFAPSPTGDMHIGNLRVAIFNYIEAKRRGESLMVRIEDTDTERNIEGKDAEILGILQIFGIEYNQVILQSEQAKYHRHFAEELLKAHKAFACFCSSKELEANKAQAKEQKRAYRYSGVCEEITYDEAKARTDDFVVRLKKPSEAISFEDAIKGVLRFEPNEVDSFVVLRSDGRPTYNFACAIDDMNHNITTIIRGEDHVSNTPKQIFIREQLGYEKQMEYVHLPIILNDSGKKMSKRDDASSVKWLLEEGFLPSAIANYLVMLGNKTPKDIFDLHEAIDFFELKNISKSPAKFDITMLRYLNREHIKRMDSKLLSMYFDFADEKIGDLAKLYLEEASTIKELHGKIEAIFSEKPKDGEFSEQIAILYEVITKAPYFEEYDAFKNYISKTSGLKGKNLFKPLRILLTSKTSGPEVKEIYGFIKGYLLEVVK